MALLKAAVEGNAQLVYSICKEEGTNLLQADAVRPGPSV